MVRALQHVVGWIDVESAVAIGAMNPKSKNKPLVCESFSATLRTLAASRGQEEAAANEAAVRLQEAVLDFVDAHVDEFKTADRAIPDECQDVSRIGGGAYADRFANGA
jgi:hypothetical protein